jgi:hypothetical protein
MLDVHAPHQTAHSWKDFFIHLATIAIGLLIALGLEQTVEFLHHRHLSNQLERQMREVFASDVEADASSMKGLGNLRAYLLELREAIKARLDGKKEFAAPSPNDVRMAIFPRFPNLAPYDAAKENGSIAYLPVARIRLFNRVAFQRELAATVRDHLFDGLAAFSAFSERYVDSSGVPEMNSAVTTPDLAKLSVPELNEYLAIVAALIKKTDLFSARIHLFDLECRAILNGVRDEDELVKAITDGMTSERR